MNLDLSAIISSITLLVSIVSPIFVTVINNRHAMRMWEAKEKDSRRQSAIENYIRNTGAAIAFGGSNLEHYRLAYGEIFLYTQDSLWEAVSTLDALILKMSDGVATDNDFKNATQIFTQLCQSLSCISPRDKHRNRRRNTK